jgi:[ribosomal protein S5]-alanine N-acetyltransferase
MTAPRLHGRRVMLRPLVPPDFAAWSEVRRRNEEWLTPWEPRRPFPEFDPTTNRTAFNSRCAARERDAANGQSYGFGLFIPDESRARDRFCGEVNINHVLRGAMQTATIGYWIDRAVAGRGLVAEGVVVVAEFAFEQLLLHRLEICIVPRNRNSRRVMEKLAIREEGVAVRALEINGVWEDHVRYGFTLEEWRARRTELTLEWLTPDPGRDPAATSRR